MKRAGRRARNGAKNSVGTITAKHAVAIRCGYPTAEIVTSLTKGKIKASSFAHFDPDIDRNALADRASNWRGVFGQCSTAQSHLRQQGVGPGDLFLFFGSYRQTEKDESGRLAFVRSSRPLHVVWGWLQIDEVVTVGKETATKFPQYKNHPHIANWGNYEGNTIYTAKPKLELPGKINVSGSGSGIFTRYTPTLCLTAPEYSSQTWRLPKSFKGLASRNKDDRHWTEDLMDKNSILFNSGGRGQEFIFDLGNITAPVAEWLAGIFGCAKS